MLSYRIRVRGITYLWGGGAVSKKLDSPLFLYFRVDEHGEEIEFGIKKAGSTILESYGKLTPGQCYIKKLDDIVGVYAMPTGSDTFVDCVILQPTED